MGNVLTRAILYSLISAVIAAIIYGMIALLTGATMNGNTIAGALVTGAISLVIALVFFCSFMLYFSYHLNNSG